MRFRGAILDRRLKKQWKKRQSECARAEAECICNGQIWSLFIDLEAINICGDCKFLFLEDLKATTPDLYRRRTLGLRMRRYNSSESIESLFSYQFSQMITLARQTQSTVLEHDNQSIDGDGVARFVQLTSTRTTPSGSRRWMRVFSDTKSDGFDSFYGENESNVSFRRYRHFPSEDDNISYTTYGGDSDASIDGNLENENL
ncbi:RING/U-box superfamily protein [Forsythia ovata]|uniref:RING/U-box superfamily protein n=1 Tax=Forsythia ovata TaxID=205694 RepID=A0ABD1QD48_9LAMI